jgi:hypothetical protein
MAHAPMITIATDTILNLAAHHADYCTACA